MDSALLSPIISRITKYYMSTFFALIIFCRVLIDDQVGRAYGIIKCETIGKAVAARDIGLL